MIIALVFVIGLIADIGLLLLWLVTCGGLCGDKEYNRKGYFCCVTKYKYVMFFKITNNELNY